MNVQSAAVLPDNRAGISGPDSLRVLLVEDDPGDARLAQVELANCSRPAMTVDRVATLAEARDSLRHTAFDVVLLDLSLPDSVGMATVAGVQAVAPTTPIVVLTGLDDPDTAEAVLGVGAQDYLTKDMMGGRELLRSIRYACTRMAAQIEREMLLLRLAREQARMAEELEEARQMQLALQPTAGLTQAVRSRLGLRVDGVLEPSDAVGGDVWGCFEVDGDRLGVFAFDFSGHGIKAALNSFRLHALIEDHPELRGDPARLLERLNAALLPMLSRGQYATMFYGVVDPAAGRLDWSAAGAPPPLLQVGDSAVFLDTTGVPLGLRGNSAYVNRSTAFRPGSVLFVYSDALSEAEKPDGEMLDDADVARLFRDAGRRNGDRLDNLLNAFRTEVVLPLADDLTAVVLQHEWVH
jgi:sigma-B regulation protein RsbU (phosphoserine phosphatase)